jgi:hypothetical protein
MTTFCMAAVDMDTGGPGSGLLPILPVLAAVLLTSF